MKRLQKTAVLLTAVILAGAFSSEDIKVEATSSTWQQIQKEQEEKNNLQNQLNEENDNLENLKGEQNSLKGQLNNLNGQLTEVSNNLSDLEQQIADKEQEIADTQASLEEAKATEAWQYECMVIRVRDMYERNETSYINALLNAQSFDKLLNAADFFERIAAYDQKKLQEFEENRKLIEEEEARLQAEKTELDSLKVAAEAEKSKTSNSIAKYAGDISEAEQRALAYEQEIKQKEENLETLRKKLAEEIAMSQKAANATWRDISDISFEEGDRYLLANLIYCEAGGEPYDGQLAVASVVINRVRSSVYPNTVVGVIYQNKQFSPVASGRLELALATNKATSRCYQAADEAMSGVTNVGNCVYFRTPVEGLTGINIGGHVFY